MSEFLPSQSHQEAFENLPSESEVISVFAMLSKGVAMAEYKRKEKQGKLVALDVIINEPNKSGQTVMLSYEVNRKGVATIDAAFFDQQKGLDYRAGQGYGPADIVNGIPLGKFVGKEWQQEGEL